MMTTEQAREKARKMFGETISEQFPEVKRAIDRLIGESERGALANPRNREMAAWYKGRIDALLDLKAQLRLP